MVPRTGREMELRAARFSADVLVAAGMPLREAHRVFMVARVNFGGAHPLLQLVTNDLDSANV